MDCFIGFSRLSYVSDHVYQIEFNESQMHKYAKFYVMIMLVLNKIIHTILFNIPNSNGTAKRKEKEERKVIELPTSCFASTRRVYAMPYMENVVCVFADGIFQKVQ